MLTIAEQLTILLDGLVPQGWNVEYVDAPINRTFNYVRYHFASGVPDGEMGSFGTDDREYVIAVQAISEDSLLAMQVAEKIDDALTGHVFALGPNWEQVGRVSFSGMVPDPGDRLSDLRLVYYSGNTYTVKATRVRVYV